MTSLPASLPSFGLFCDGASPSYSRFVAYLDYALGLSQRRLQQPGQALVAVRSASLRRFSTLTPGLVISPTIQRIGLCSGGSSGPTCRFDAGGSLGQSWCGQRSPSFVYVKGRGPTTLASVPSQHRSGCVRVPLIYACQCPINFTLVCVVVHSSFPPRAPCLCTLYMTGRLSYRVCASVHSRPLSVLHARDSLPSCSHRRSQPPPPPLSCCICLSSQVSGSGSDPRSRFAQPAEPGAQVRFNSARSMNPNLNIGSGSGANPVHRVREPDRGQSIRESALQ